MIPKASEIWDINFAKWGPHPGLVFHADEKSCWACLITESALPSDRHISWVLLPGQEGGHPTTGLTKPSTLKPDRLELVKTPQLIAQRGVVDALTFHNASGWAAEILQKQGRT